MKKGIIAIAGGILVSATIIGCGGDTTQLENDLKEAKQRTQFVADSISLEYQAKVDSLQAVIDGLTASTETGTTTTETNTGSKPKPKTEEQPKKSEDNKLDVGTKTDNKLDVGTDQEKSEGVSKKLKVKP